VTYQEERKIKDVEKARRAKKYRYEPVLFDATRVDYVIPGQVVIKVQPHGCPRNGTMGMCYVGEADTGKFLGMVCLNSLVPA
jgi:hypothetical protein